MINDHLAAQIACFDFISQNLGLYGYEECPSTLVVFINGWEHLLLLDDMMLDLIDVDRGSPVF